MLEGKKHTLIELDSLVQKDLVKSQSVGDNNEITG